MDVKNIVQLEVALNVKIFMIYMKKNAMRKLTIARNIIYMDAFNVKLIILYKISNASLL